MTQRMMVRSFLVAFVALSLLAAPVAVAGEERPAERTQSGWVVELGELVSRAWALILGDRIIDWGAEDRQDPADGISSRSGNDESDGGSNNDPNG